LPYSDLFDALHTADGAVLPNKGSKEFFARIREFAFFSDLNKALGGRLEALVQEQRWSAVLKALLLEADRRPRLRRAAQGSACAFTATRTPMSARRSRSTWSRARATAVAPTAWCACTSRCRRTTWTAFASRWRRCAHDSSRSCSAASTSPTRCRRSRPTPLRSRPPTSRFVSPTARCSSAPLATAR
jgi:hypothetical protein